MIDLAEAWRLIEQTATPLPARRELLGRAVGRVLAEAVCSDIDSPAWDRSMMDGFAVCAADFSAAADSPVELDVVVAVAAGELSDVEIRPGTAARIMTGAALPAGAEAVVPVERAVEGTAAATTGSRVRLVEPHFRHGQHIAFFGPAFGDGLVGGRRHAHMPLGHGDTCGDGLV